MGTDITQASGLTIWLSAALLGVAFFPGQAVVARPGDVVIYDGVSYAIHFDALAKSVPDGVHTNAVTQGDIETLVLSFDTSGSVGGVDFDDEDVLEYDPIDGTWEMAWDASVERTEWVNGADVNAVYFVPERSPRES